MNQIATIAALCFDENPHSEHFHYYLNLSENKKVSKTHSRHNHDNFDSVLHMPDNPLLKQLNGDPLLVLCILPYNQTIQQK
jgi:hypothetical protein